MSVQIGMRSLSRQTAFVEDKDSVSQANGAKTVRDDEDRTVLHQLFDGSLDNALALGVEGRSGFIEDENRCVSQEGPSNS